MLILICTYRQCKQTLLILIIIIILIYKDVNLHIINYVGNVNLITRELRLKAKGKVSIDLVKSYIDKIETISKSDKNYIIKYILIRRISYNCKKAIKTIL